MSSNVPDEAWGARLRRLREARDMSRKDLADALTQLGRRTCGRNDIRRYEEDNLYPRVPTFAALARVLDVSMEVLLYGEEEAARIAEERERVGGDVSTRRA